MKDEEKQLLLKDICARLPYGVKILHRDSIEEITEITPAGEFKNRRYDAWFDIDNCRPYLRPMSSMTEEESEDWAKASNMKFDMEDGFFDAYDAHLSVDWLNEHHFDYRGLIDKGLALEATEEMYKNAKDALLEWAKEMKEQVSIGLNAYDMGEENGKAEILNKLIDKLNSL